MQGDAECHDGDAGGVRDALGELKRRGCSLLLTGAVPDAAGASCRPMLGADGSRSHLLVRTDSSAPVETRLGGPSAGSGTVTVVDRRVDARTSAAASAGLGDDAVTFTVADPGLGALGGTVVDAVESARDRNLGFDPAELRVCFDSVLPLVEEHDLEAVFRFLHLLTGKVRQESAMAHFHLPVDADAEAARVLEPLFDAVIERRVVGDTVQQRWHLRDADVSTDWFVR